MALDLSTLPPAPAAQLGDYELLAVLLNRSLPTAAALLARFGGVAALARAPIHELARARIPPRRAQQLIAALELGRRSLTEPLARGQPLDSAPLASEVMRARLAHREQEELHVIGLDVRQCVLIEFVAAVGNVAEVYVDPRDVFRPLVRENASSAIIVHNHPSGEPHPSDADRQLTRQLAAAGDVLGVQLVDHIIVARAGTYSFAESGDL
jgi:DNA repair protein RadC